MNPALRRGREALDALLGPGDPGDPEKDPKDAATDALIWLDLAPREQLRDACLEILGILDGIGWEPDEEPGRHWVRG